MNYLEFTALTPAERAELQALADAATPGPWEWGLDPIIEPGYHTQVHVYVGPHPRHQAAIRIADVDYDRQVDADFIAAARTAVPRLLATLAAAEAEIARLRAGLAETRTAIAQAHGKAQTVAHYDAVALLERAMTRIDALLAERG